MCTTSCQQWWRRWWRWWRQCKWCYKWRCKSRCKQRSALTHFLCHTHLAHRSSGVQGVHEEESARMLRCVVMARRKTGWTGTEAGRAWGSTLDERGNRTESRRATTGGREAGWVWDNTMDERRQHESGARYGKEDRCPEAVGVSQGTQHNEAAQRAVGVGAAPCTTRQMSA